MNKIDKIAEIWSNGVQVKLILYVPNNKNIINLEEAPFFNRLLDYKERESFFYSKMYFEELKEEIKDYCELEGFYTDDGDNALELEINEVI